MFFQVMKINANNILSFEPYIPDTYLNQITEEEVAMWGLLTEDKRSCGAIVCRQNVWERSVFIESVSVDENYRRRGGGTMLVNQVMDAVQKRATHLVCRILPPNLIEQQAFWISCGVTEFMPGEWFFAFSKEELGEWFESDSGRLFEKASKQSRRTILPLSDVVRSQRQKFSDQTCDDDLSFVVEGREIKSYMLAVKDRKKDDILIQRLVTVRKQTPTSMALVYKAFRAYYEMLPEGGMLYIKSKALNEKGLWEILIPTITFEYVLYGRKTLKYIPPEEATISRAAMAAPRLNAIADIVDLGGYTYTSQIDDDLGCYIYLQRKENKRPVSISCEWEGNAEWNLFRVEIYSSFAYSSLSDREKKKLIKLRDTSRLVNVVIAEEQDFARISLGLTEGEYPTAEELFLTLLASFIKELDTLTAKEEPVLNSTIRQRNWEEEE